MNRFARMLLIAAMLAGLRATAHPGTLAVQLAAQETEPVPSVTLEASRPVRLRPTAGAVADTAGIAAPGNVLYDPTSVYDQKGLNAVRGFSAAAPTELIDPFSGNLILRQRDLYLPGVGGLDLVLQRVYNSKIHRNYAARASGDASRIATGMLFVPPSPLGLGWTMHLGRIVGGANSGPNDLLSGPRYYEASDGSQYPFFTYSGAGCGNGSTDVCLVTKGFDNPYQLAVNGPWYLAMANGLNITFGHTAFDGTNIVHYATEIRDIHGNRIQITYHDNTIPGIGVQRDYFRHFIDTIIDSAGRNIAFGYSVVNSPDVVRLTSITAAGRTYRYVYTSSTPWGPIYAFLASAEPPAGAPWRYTYAGLNNGDCADNSKRWCELTGLTHPTGGTVAYTFSDLTFWAQTNPMAVRAVTQRVIGGRQISPATWTYQYNRAANYSGDEHTIITRPGGSEEIYTYFGVGNSTYNPLGQAWKAGVLLQKRVRQGATVLQTETFDWIASPAISNETWGDPWIGFDTGVFLPRLQQHTIQRGSLTWTTTHTTYNDHNNTPRCTTEAGDGATRYRLNTYTAASAQQGDYLFTFVNLPVTAGLSYTAFSSAQCNPQQSSSWTPGLGDELTYRTYDAEGQLTAQEVNGLITDYQYHGDGSLKAEITYQGANRTSGFCTVHSDYQYGVPRTTTYGAAAPACTGGVYSVQRTLNPDGSTQQVTDGRGHSTTFLYDGLGRHTRISPPGQAPIVITYDGSASSFATQRRVEQGSYWLESRFDGFGRNLEQESSAGIHMRETYDALGQVIFSSLPSSSAGSTAGETFTYDALGRLLTVTHADGSDVTYSYGTAAHTVTITDEAGRVTVHTRRAFAHPYDYRLVRVQLPGEPAPAADTYTYLVGGQLTGVNYGGQQRTIEYSFAKQVRRERSPESGDTYYGYDAAGNLRCRHWTPLCSDTAYTNPGNEVRYTVDALNRVTEINYLTYPDVTLTYDEANNVKTMSDGAGMHTFTYNDANQLTQRTSTIEGVAYVTAYGYDNRGNLTRITYPSGRAVTYGRDSGNRITSVDGFVNSIEYHPNGMTSRLTYANGIVTTLSLDSRQRPDALQAGSVLNLNYNFDGSDNLERLADGITPNNTTDFDYDGLDRLTDASGPWGSLHYTYNAAGDRTAETLNGQTTTYTYNGDGQLTSLSGRVNLNYGYDARGNVGSRGGYSYQHDEEDRLSAVSGPDIYITYAYDGAGQQMIARRQGCQNSRVYHYDQDGARIAEYTLEGVLLKEYIVLDGRTVAELDYTPAAVSASEIDFGDVEAFTTVTRTLTITNHTTLPITLDDLGLNLPFGLGVAEPVVIPADSSLVLPITFRPLQRGEAATRLEVCDESGLRLDVSLRGRGVAPVAVLSPASFDLGDVPYGSTVTRTFTVSNTGDAPLRIAQWSASDAALVVTPAGAATIQPGAAQSFVLGFNSTSTCGGPYAGSAYLAANGLGSTNANVTANVLALEVDTRGLEFGPVGAGDTRTLNVTLRNRAAVPLTPQLAFDGAPQFTVGTLPAASLMPGASVQIPVTYRPAGKPWSPFGDHAMLRAGFLECSLVCTASAHLIGNVSAEVVPQGGQTPAIALVGNTTHVASVLTTTLHYGVRDGSGGWTQGPDPTDGGAVRVNNPALLAGPGDRLTILWEDFGANFQIMMRQRNGQGGWENLCTQAGFRRGWGPLALDDAGNVWLTWLDRLTFALDVSPVFTAAGVCQAGQPPRIAQIGISWDSLNLARGPAGQLGLAVTLSERLRFLRLDLTGNTATVETPVNSEVGFNSTAAIAVDGQGGWHLVWPEIFIGQQYDAPARYVYRDPNQGWQEPLTLMTGSHDAGSLRVAVDSLGGVHVAWSDLACAAPDQRKIYYATKPAFSTRWQVSDVSTPGYVGFDVALAMVLSDDRLAAAWNGNGNAMTLLSGQTDVGARVSGSHVLTTTVTPGQGGSLTAPDGHIEIQFPPGAVSSDTEVTYTRQTQPVPPPGALRFAGRSFTIVANSASGPVTQLGAPFTLILHYDDADWQAAGLAREEDLNLYVWDGSQWQALLPCDGCAQDTVNNTLTARLDHLSEFALLGNVLASLDETTFLPAVLRGATP